MKKKTVLIVDDSVLYRRFVREAISAISGTEVIGHASNGANALTQIEVLQPDIVLLDIHMPGQNGIDVLQDMRGRDNLPAIIVLTSESSPEVTTKALALGAFDCIVKPTESTPEKNHSLLVDKLEQRINAIAKSSQFKNHSTSSSTCSENSTQNSTDDTSIDVVVIGSSTGGPAALMEVLPRIPSDFGLPILIVQHMPPMFTRNLAQDLNNVSQLHIQEGTDCCEVQPGNVYIAPGGKQMKVEASFPNPILRIDDSPPENHCKPSVNYLLRSVASIYDRRVLVAIMTGMGSDGTAGCELIARKGGKIITQDADSCVVYGMPRSVDEAGLSQESCTLEQIAMRLTETAKKEKELRCRH